MVSALGLFASATQICEAVDLPRVRGGVGGGRVGGNSRTQGTERGEGTGGEASGPRHSKLRRVGSGLGRGGDRTGL